MATTVKKAVLWRTEVENKAGALASILEPLAKAEADLQAVMGYRIPGDTIKAVIELYPVSGKKRAAAAQAAGLSASAIPALAIEGDNKVGMGHAMAQALAGAGINIDFLVVQVVGKKYSAIIGFENRDDAAKAAGIIKKAAVGKKK